MKRRSRRTLFDSREEDAFKLKAGAKSNIRDVDVAFQ